MNEIFVILCVLFIFGGSNGVSIISKFDLNENFAANEEEILDIFPTINTDIAEDVNLTTLQLIEKYGYEGELLYVTTEDGYILELHRIIGKLGQPKGKKKDVCLLQHGLLTTSASWILAGPNHALGYRLADENFDVWLSNSRGNMYGCNHTTLNPFGSSKERKKFWSFSFHEMGVFDVPAIIDYVLMQTKVSKLQYIGHSQGTASFFVMASQKLEYNDKIELKHALAPIAFMSHVISPPIRVLAPFAYSAEEIISLLGINYVNPTDRFLTLSEEALCREKAPTQIICRSLLYLIAGYTSDQLNTTLLPLILGYPAAASVMQLLHFGQEVRSGHFRQFDYGYLENLRRYKHWSPPSYNLSNVNAPTALYYAYDDWLADCKDVENLSKLLPNVIINYMIPHERFNHLDFLYGIDVQHLLYDELLKNIKAICQMKYNSVDYQYKDMTMVEKKGYFNKESY